MKMPVVVDDEQWRHLELELYRLGGLLQGKTTSDPYGRSTHTIVKELIVWVQDMRVDDNG